MQFNSSQLDFYKKLLKDNEILLLKSQDSFFQNHYSTSPLSCLTNFRGTAGEGILDKNGNITLFVDTRYHLLAQKLEKKNLKIEKMPLGKSFIECLREKYPKNTVLFVPSDIKMRTYFELDSHFDLRSYKIPAKYSQNKDINYKNKIFKVGNEIEKNDFELKIEKIKKSRGKIDRLIVSNLDEISYLTNLRSYQLKYSSNFASIMYLDFKNSNYILFLEKENFKIAKNFEIKNLVIKNFSEFKNLMLNIEDEIYLSLEDISLDCFLIIKNPKEIKKKFIQSLASIKPMNVIEHLKDSSYKLDIALYNFKNKLKKSLKEEDLAKLFENELLKAGAISPSFKTLLALDENSASIHHSDYDYSKSLNEENLILLDCGGYYEGGYATDITRVFYFGQNPKPIYKEIYTMVLKAFFACYNSKVTDAKKLDEIARTILEPYFSKGFNFNHGLGHGIGTSVHQYPPTLSMYSNDIIKPYQVHSIEPGLYGGLDTIFGIRLENCCYSDINYNKISLSKFPFEEVLINYNMLNLNELEALKKWQNDFKI